MVKYSRKEYKAVQYWKALLKKKRPQPFLFYYILLAQTKKSNSTMTSKMVKIQYGAAQHSTVPGSTVPESTP